MVVGKGNQVKEPQRSHLSGDRRMEWRRENIQKVQFISRNILVGDVFEILTSYNSKETYV